MVILNLRINLLAIIPILTAMLQPANCDAQYLTTKSGLQYRINELGNSHRPQNGCRVWVKYEGRLAQTDSIFVTTDNTGEADFWMGQGQIIKGWEEALPLIGEGGSISLIVPPQLGYADMDVAGIPHGSTLKFDITLLQVDDFRPINPFRTDGIKPLKHKCGISQFTIAAGSGEPARAGDNVYVHFTGWLPDGTIYTSTRNIGDARRFTAGAGETFEGMDSALMMMPEGARCRFVIPYQLAFGNEGFGNRIPTRTDVTLDIEMVRISRQISISKWDATGRDTLATPSGLRYIVFSTGSGNLIRHDNIVTAHYSAYISNDKLVDSSVKRETPIRYPVGAGFVIDGWEEGSLLMRKGGRYQLLVPSWLAYGNEGLPPDVPANADMIFDIEILDVME